MILDVGMITMVESKREYVCYHYGGQKILCYGALKNVYEYLPQLSFIQIHRSFIINFDYIESFTMSDVTLKNGFRITIGRIYQSEFKKRVTEYFLHLKRYNMDSSNSL